MGFEYYRLVGKVVVPCATYNDFQAWNTATLSLCKRVAYSAIGDIIISTVFHGKNTQLDLTLPPAIFESCLISNDATNNFCDSYADWEAAWDGHYEILIQWRLNHPVERKRFKFLRRK